MYIFKYMKRYIFTYIYVMYLHVYKYLCITLRYSWPCARGRTPRDSGPFTLSLETSPDAHGILSKWYKDRADGRLLSLILNKEIR